MYALNSIFYINISWFSVYYGNSFSGHTAIDRQVYVK